MALKALSWLSENLGIDITGETDKDGNSEGVLERLGKSVFGDQAEDETGIPQETWGYKYNPATGQWELTENAPAHVVQEQQERLQAMNAPPKEVAPPPVMPTPNFNWSRDMKGPKYADHFNSYASGGPTPPSGASPTGELGSPTFSTNCINPAAHIPESAPPGPEVVQEQSTAMLQFAPPPLPQMQAVEMPVASMVQLSAPLPPPPAPVPPMAAHNFLPAQQLYTPVMNGIPQ